MSIIADLGKISKVMARLYLSGFTTAADLKKLKERNIVLIVNCASRLANSFEDSGEFEYMNLGLEDSDYQRVYDILDSTVDKIHTTMKEKGAVLVHCQMGMSRSPTIVIAYLMKHCRKRFDAAMEFVQERRSCAWPNMNFQKQLRKYELKLFGPPKGDPEAEGEGVGESQGDAPSAAAAAVAESGSSRPKKKSKCCVM